MPVVAAACGVAVPALIYLVVNGASEAGRPGGWAIPAQTLRLVNRTGERILGRPAEQLLARSADTLGLDGAWSARRRASSPWTFPGGTGRWEVRRTTFRLGGRGTICWSWPTSAGRCARKNGRRGSA